MHDTSQTHPLQVPRRLQQPVQLGAAQAEQFAATFEALAAAVDTVVLGKPEVVRLALTAMFAQGHILLEDVPGTGKTTLARTIAAAVSGQWRRIQFTPDLLPSDVSGVTIFNQVNGAFEFHPGPVFANIVIADEINRASPKTQSALLEVMEEGRVTVDGNPHQVPQPFLVVATQNPVEMDGTYRLPEAQLGRFLVKLSVGYPVEAAEIEVKAGAGYQKRRYDGVPLHFGLGARAAAEVVRVTWPNGLIQNETAQAAGGSAAIREAQRLSGSCPMVFNCMSVPRTATIRSTPRSSAMTESSPFSRTSIVCAFRYSTTAA